MKTNEIKATALEIVANVYSCKELKEKHYKPLVDEYGKDNAKAIIAKAKELLNTHNVATKANATKVIDGLKDGNRILVSTWESILKDKSINTFAKIVYKNCNNDLITMLNKFASLKNDKGVCSLKHYSKRLDVVYYTEFDIYTSTPTQALKIAKDAIRNAKTAAIKGRYNFKVVTTTKTE